jgi:para-nitrobenzyl esterase
MKHSLFHAGLVSASLLLLAGCGPKAVQTAEPAHPGPITAGAHTRVNTVYGTVEGYLDDDVYTFKGIQYAKADRFMPPQAPDKFDGVRMCKLYGPKAPQRLDLVWRDNTQTDYYFGNQFVIEPMDEKACLVLNVWTKGINDGKKRPVFVWTHGGGFSSGSGHDLGCYEGRALADKGDIVTITINHRLNILGYADLRALGGKYSESVNLGHQDIVKALEWIHDNIEKFGGDPNCVTIGGQSGGGGKVSNTMAMPSAKGLIHRAIIQSGSGPRSGDAEASIKFGPVFLQELGVKPAQAETKLDSFTYEELVDAGNRATARLAKDGVRVSFGPVKDGKYIAEHPFDEVATDISKNVPLLVGCNFNEMQFDISPEKTEAEVKTALTERMGEEKAAKYMEAFKKAYPNEEPKAMLYVDTRTRGNAEHQALLKSRQGTKSFLYLFTWKPENNVLGASHGMELPFMFNNIANQREMTGSSESAYKLADIMSDYWIAFIKNGDPNVEGRPVWEPYNEETRPTMVLDNTCETRHGHDSELIDMMRQ